MEEFDSSVTNKELLEASRDWCTNQGMKKPFGSKTIASELLKRGFEKFRTGRERGFSGLTFEAAMTLVTLGDAVSSYPVSCVCARGRRFRL